MQYKNTVPPVGNDLEALKNWAQSELSRISAELSQVKQLAMNVQNPLPQRYARGDIYYFDAGIVGLVEGPYFYDGSTWHFMGDYPPARGALYFNTTVSFSMPVANTFYKVAPYTLQGATPVDVTQDPTNGTLTINRDGIYTAQGFVDFLNPAPNQQYSIAFFRNGVIAPLTEVRTTAKDNNDGVNLNTIIVAALVAGDVLDIRVKCGSITTLSLITGLLSVIQQQ